MEKQNRIITIILTDLSLENLKLHEELENLINSEKSLDDKIDMTNFLLQKIVINELKITKFNALLEGNKETK